EEPKVIEKILEHLGLNQAAMPNNRSPPAGHHDLFDQVTTLICRLCDTTERRSVLTLVWDSRLSFL
ncbi:MAG: hypothetical protein ACI9VI_001061, partial [Candidatus Azotimanducaceae bacterium]